MNDEGIGKQSGGVNVFGGSISAGGDVVGHDKGDVIGHDKIVDSQISTTELESAFSPLMDTLRNTPTEIKEAASQNVEAIRKEVSKGKEAKDGVIAKLIDGLVALAPHAAGAVVAAFGSPLLAGVAGPATKYVLDKIVHKDSTG